jgi:hypothetical protein
MKKILLVFICFSFFAAINAYSAEIAWVYVQHREYGEKKNLNRLSFGLVDHQLNYLTDDATVAAVKLYDSAGKEVKLSSHKFASLEEMYGAYDSKNSQFRYSTNWQFDSWFSVEILDALIPGTYRLSVKTTDGKVVERSYEFNKRIVLPIVDHRSIQIRRDLHGNMILTWQVPEDMGFLALRSKTRARASIDIYKNDQNVAYFSIILPSHMGYVYLPIDVVERINQRGDRFEFKISLETRDKNNRTYSKPFILDKELSAKKD